jgi:hypothetical protein
MRPRRPSRPRRLSLEGALNALIAALEDSPVVSEISTLPPKLEVAAESVDTTSELNNVSASVASPPQ